MIRVCLMGLVCFAGAASSSQVFTGLDVEFRKAGFADPALEENQDRITDSVWITRDSSRGIFNIARETGFQGQGADSPSPIGTRWAAGSAADFQSLAFGTWGDLHQGSPFGLIGQDLALHLVEDDIYLDLRFTAWGVGAGSGGSVTYFRSAIPAPPAGALLASAGLFAGCRRR